MILNLNISGTVIKKLSEKHDVTRDEEVKIYEKYT